MQAPTGSNFVLYCFDCPPHRSWMVNYHAILSLRTRKINQNLSSLRSVSSPRRVLLLCPVPVPLSCTVVCETLTFRVVVSALIPRYVVVARDAFLPPTTNVRCGPTQGLGELYALVMKQCDENQAPDIMRLVLEERREAGGTMAPDAHAFSSTLSCFGKVR